MSEINKRHNRKIWRACPVCKGRVVLGYRNQNWWVHCEYDASHIPQRFFPYPHEAIETWNVKGNKMTNADLIRAMSDEELAELISFVFATGAQRIRSSQFWKDWLRQEVEENECNCKEIFENTADCPCDNCEKMKE